MPIDLRALTADPPSYDSLIRARAEAAVAWQARGGLAAMDMGVDFSWDAHADHAGRAAAWLAARGIGPGDRVAIWGQTSYAWAVWLAACAWRGAALVAIHPNLGREDMLAAVRQSDPVWLLVDERARGTQLGAMAKDAARETDLRGVTVMPGGDGVFDLDGLLADAGTAPAPIPNPDPRAPLNIQFTSGSTGRPKAVVLSHAALIANAAMTAQALGITAGDRIAAPLPLFHSAGLSTCLILAVVVDAWWVGFHRFQTEPVLAAVVDRPCSVLVGVPTMFSSLLDRMAATGTATPNLRLCVAGGAFLPPDLCERTVREMGLAHMGMVYGQTEFAPTVSVTRGDEPADLKYTTAGPPLPGVTVRIVDPETLEDTEEGEIWIKGPTQMNGYFGDAEATAAAITPDGWLRTGDRGRMVGGCLRVTARLKELIIRGGENVSPYEVEEALRTAPGVADVCVVPVASAHWGEEICAVIVPDPSGEIDEAVVRVHAEARLGRHMRPDRYDMRAELPLLANGKIDRRAVKALVARGETT